MNNMKSHRVVILGGGFGGLYTALRLDKTIARRIDVEVTLVNRENFFLFTPMLHEVAASDLDITNIVNPIRKMLRRVHFFAGDVDAIDLGNKQVTVSHGIHPHHHVLEYDQLAIGLGAITNFFNLPGLAEHALTMKTLGDAIYLRNRAIANLEEANFECKKADRGRLLTFVIAGGGFAGVETASALNDFLREALRFYPNLAPAMINVLVVHPGAVILPELSEKLGRYAQRKLGQRKIDVRVNCRVTGMSKGGVELSDGRCIETDTLIWTAGMTPNPKLDELPCAKERGRIAVNEYMEVAGFPGVWALGDCAAIPDPMTGKPQPPTAQHALREGRVLAANIQAYLASGKKQAFSFRTIGQLASIGKRTGVANILGINFSGFIAWWLWRTIYLRKLPRFEKKLRVLLDWTLDLIFSKDLVQFLTVRAPSVSDTQEK